MTGTSDPITRAVVEAAVQALAAAGRRASWREVRKHLGKGSPNTILAHLRAIDGEARATAARQEPVPPAAITDLVGTKVWQAALAAAREQVAADRQDLEVRLQAEEARCIDLAGLVERLEEQVLEARRQADAQLEVLARLQQGQAAQAQAQAGLLSAIAALGERWEGRMGALDSAIAGLAVAQDRAAAVAGTRHQEHLAALEQAAGGLDGRIGTMAGAVVAAQAEQAALLRQVGGAVQAEVAQVAASVEAATVRSAERDRLHAEAEVRWQTRTGERLDGQTAALGAVARQLEVLAARQQALAAADEAQAARQDALRAALPELVAAAVRSALPPAACPPPAEPAG